MQNDAMTPAQMLAMEKPEVVFGPLIVLVIAAVVVSLIVLTVMWAKKRRAAKEQLQDT